MICDLETQYDSLLATQGLIELRPYVPLDPKISHFGDVLPSQSLGLVMKNKNKHNKSKHVSVTKYATT